jgi:hypothetical protein
MLARQLDCVGRKPLIKSTNVPCTIYSQKRLGVIYSEIGWMVECFVGPEYLALSNVFKEGAVHGTFHRDYDICVEVDRRPYI